MRSNGPRYFSTFPKEISLYVLLRISGQNDLAFYHRILTLRDDLRSLPPFKYFKGAIPYEFYPLEHQGFLRPKFRHRLYTFEYAGVVGEFREVIEPWKECTHRSFSIRID
jgi:hypothetical protein